MTFTSRGVALVGMALVCQLAACSQNEDITAESSDSDLTGRVSGSSLSSPNAKHGATYLSARRIDTLEQVGALAGALDGLAKRVDGIIANQPADGRFSITELLQIEKPGYVETLFPEEKAALPGLWALLETTNDAPVAVTAAAPMTVGAVDVSTPAGAPIEPASLAVSSLPSSLQTPAERLELTHDDDGNASTVTKADLNAAIASPGPYTPAEVASFKDILALFVARAGTSLAAKVQVPAPTATKSTLATFGSATLDLEESLAYTETRSSWLTGNPGAGSIDVKIAAHHVWNASLGLGANQSVVVIDETTEAESVHGAGVFDVPSAGNATIEIWSGGTRLGSWRAAFPVLAHVDANVDLSAYADYTFVAGGTPLVRNVASATQKFDSWYNRYYGNESSTTNSASFTYDLAAKAPTGEVSAAGLAAVATPAPPVTPGRYEITAGSAGVVDIDVYPEGVVRVTRAGGASMRAALYHWEPTTKWDADFPDRFRVLLDPAGNLEVFFDGQSYLFNGPLAGAQRKG